MKVRTKKIVDKDVFKDLTLQAANILADPVAMTLGPEGLPILLEKEKISPILTKDGVTVAKHVSVAGEVNNIIESMKEASQKTNDEVGDGTTTAVVLMRELIKEGVKYIKSGTISPQKLVRDLKNEEERIMRELDTISKPVETKQDQFHVACISSNNDKQIASKIVEALEMAGENGYIALEEGYERDTTVSFVEGYTLETGWSRLGPHGITFVTHPQQGYIELNEPAIVIYDGSLSDMHDVASFMEILTNHGINKVPLLVIAYEITGMAFEMMLANRRAGYQLAPLKCPMIGSPNIRRYILEDLAVFTGGKVIDHGPNAIAMASIENKVLQDGSQNLVLREGVIGSCKKVIIKKNDVIIYGGTGDDDEKIRHMENLKQQLADADNEWEKELIKNRMSKMVGGVTEIGVGGVTELEMKEKKFRIEDALNATRAAIEAGIVPGGGKALLHVAQLLYKNPSTIVDRIMQTTLEAPIRQILKNADVQPDVVISKIRENSFGEGDKMNPAYGYDARDMAYADLYQIGIIDPVKVTKHALKNAMSIACELLSGGGMIAIEEEKNPLKGLTKEDMLPDLYENESQEF